MGSVPVSFPEPVDSAGMMLRPAQCCQLTPLEGGRDANPCSHSRADYQDLCVPVQAVSTKKRNTLKNRRGRMATLQLAVTNSKCRSQHIMRSQASPFFVQRAQTNRKRESFDFDVGLLIKNTQVLRACVKASVKIFTVALKIADGTDGGLKEDFVSQCHSKTLPLHQNSKLYF